jgi:predicted MFS family arabinose efflux permease
VRDLGLSAAQVATLFTIVGTAGVAGAVFSGRILRRVGLGPGLIVGTAVAASGTLVVPLVTGPPDHALFVLGVMSATIGLSQPLLFVGVGSIRQGCPPAAMRGRALASMYFLVIGVVPAGALLGGALGDALGARTALLIAAVGLLLAPISLVFSPVRNLRTVPIAS